MYVMHTVFVVLTDTYGISVTLFLLIRLFIDEFDWSFIGIFNALFPTILLPSFIMFIGSLYIRRWRLALFTIPAMLAFVLSYGMFFLPNSIDVPEDAPTLSVLTYNTKHIAQDLDKWATLILDADADVVLLQEMSSEVADYFRYELVEVYPFQSLHDTETVMGQGVLSRYPIESEDFFEIERRQGFLHVEIDFDGQLISVYNIHPHVPLSLMSGFTDKGGFHGNRHFEAIETIIESAQNSEIPVIIAGDMNMTDQFTAYQHITKFYDDAYREVGWGLGLTFPDIRNSSLFFFPLVVRLDYVFYSQNWQAIEAHVWSDSGGSDHRPLFVTLAMVGD